MFRTAVILCACALLFSSASAVVAADRNNVMVMGLDADDGSAGSGTVVVARDTRVFNQVLETLSQRLTQSGVDVYDERRITLDGFKQDRVSRSEDELLDIARSVQKPPIDAAVIFTIYAGARRLTYTTEVYARIAARIVDVKSGRKLGSFEVTSPRGWRAPVGCEHDCLLEVIGKSSASIADELGAQVSRKLVSLTPPRAVPRSGYLIAFARFSPQELKEAEEYLVAFKGYRQHRNVSSTTRETQMDYATDSDTQTLARNLQMMVERLGLSAKIRTDADGRTIRIEKDAG